MKTSKNVAHNHICGYIMLQVRWLNLLPHLCFNIWRKGKVYNFLAIWKHHLTTWQKDERNEGDEVAWLSYHDVKSFVFMHATPYGKGCTRMAIIWLSQVFKNLCTKIADPLTMGDLKHDVGLTLVLLTW